MSLEKVIKEILRDYNIIDTGVSKTIAETIEPMLQETINQELNVSQFAVIAMQGLLANPDMSEMPKSEVISISIEYAYELFDGLQAKRTNRNSVN